MESVGGDMSDYGRGSLDNNNIVRKEMGLEWMLRPKDNIERETATTTASDQLEEPQVEEVCRPLHKLILTSHCSI
ncbi:hypothetical protein LOK49_LG06G02812 [Camellia lanceoleosa]|uniref:Uncharacterized protein n=1 Tax=Camellia lanceoleosa TaxID=1840588 RepID=A0ACC0HJF9_9ERIC|nr:hypothetical protein LOK49_LG06G02812 [Camellia lanceoleosa]